MHFYNSLRKTGGLIFLYVCNDENLFLEICTLLVFSFRALLGKLQGLDGLYGGRAWFGWVFWREGWGWMGIVDGGLGLVKMVG